MRVGVGSLAAGALLLLLALPVFALVLATSGPDLAAGVRSPQFVPALMLSLRTGAWSTLAVVTGGTPLAWWLVQTRSPARHPVSVLVDLPLVVPPAVIGVGLLQAFGRQGLLGPALDLIGVAIPFTESAVVLAQIVVSGPFFVQAAANAFRKVDPSTLAVAHTLGASPREAFFKVAIPIARPGLIAGATLAWARATGEFGATLVFAGNLPKTTQTLPLAVFSALESNIQLAVTLSLLLLTVGVGVLTLVRWAPLWARGGT